MTVATGLCPYDEIAESYDWLWRSPEALAEDKEVMQSLKYKGGSVLDIGCGTGLFLEHHPDCSEYVGVDPSPKMLARLTKKHGEHELVNDTFEGAYQRLASRRFDLIVSLYGSPSYVSTEDLAKAPLLLKPGGKIVFMFYAPGYKPVTHQHLSSPPVIHEHLAEIYGKARRFGNYVVARA
jgi:SAM-dependent methyltransferase